MSIGGIADCLGVDKSAFSAEEISRVITGAAIDSRCVKQGDLFICLPGEKADGHDFAPAAVRAGAELILATRQIDGAEAPVIQVDNAEEALQHLAAYLRRNFKGKVVGLTGTAGKTTLKDMLVQIMKKTCSVSHTEGNHNNQLGVPLTILNADEQAQVWVLELGISHAGDMDLLGRIARPDMAIILNVGTGHTEGLGGKGVAWHKARLLHYLPADGIALINADYPDLLRECAYRKDNIITFGSKNTGSLFFMENKANGETVLHIAGNEMRTSLPFIGAYAGETLLCAAAAAYLLGADPAAIREGLGAAKKPPHRFELQTSGNFHIFDDTYNANPFSMHKMLDAVKSYADQKNLPLLLFLGEMGELGADAAAMHEKLGVKLAELSPAAICYKGRFAAEVKHGLQARGAHIPFHAWTNHDQFQCVIEDIDKNLMQQELAVLFKGSRLNKLENELEQFRQLASRRTGSVHVL